MVSYCKQIILVQKSYNRIIAVAGALERLMQKVIFEGTVSDANYPDMVDQCSGSQYSVCTCCNALHS
jgi:hypothetical protein